MDYLRDIYSEDIELLIADIKLLKLGYELNYIIDSSDIITYSFPYGLSFDQLESKSLDEIGDELIAYEYIFRNYRPILLDEYKLELLINRNIVKESADKRFNKNLLEIYLKKDQGEKKVIEEDLFKSATYLLASALMNETFIEIFDDIYYNKLQTDSLQVKNKKDQEALSLIYKNVRRSEWSKNSFIKWAEKNKNDNSDADELLKEYKSTYRDYVVIDRVCRINETIQEDNSLESKYLFLYYSGAKKSEFIFETEEVKEHLPTIDNRNNYNLLRTTKHSYLLFLIYDDDLEKMESSLLKLKGIAEKKESNVSLSKKMKRWGITGNSLFEDIDKKKREILEYTAISTQIKNHSQYQKLIREKIKKLRRSGTDEEFAAGYEKILLDAKFATEKIGIIQLDLAYSVQGKFLNLLKILVDKKEFTISKGKDLIRGTYHHLPILLFFDSNSNIDKLKERLFLNVIDFVVKSARFRKESLSSFISSIRELYVKIEMIDEYKEKYYDILLKFFIYSILESPKRDQSEAYKLLKDSSVILEASKEALEKWKDDYNYMLAWASRRNREFVESLQTCENGIGDFPNDPRFYHGKCLALYNLNYKENSLETCGLNKLKEIIKTAENAKALYIMAMETPERFRKEYFPYIKGSIQAINNLIMYCIALYYLSLFEKNEKESDELLKKYSIESLRAELLANIRSQDSKINQISKELPEFLHSESILELIEAINAYHSEQFKLAERKIDVSIKAIGAAIECEPNSQLYLVTMDRIKSWESRISKA